VHEEEDGEEATAAEGIHEIREELRAVRDDLSKVSKEISRAQESITDVEEKLKVLLGIKFENMCNPFL
jgi:predicted  nucleic acid-binding Zn-ribbon protein